MSRQRLIVIGLALAVLLPVPALSSAVSDSTDWWCKVCPSSRRARLTQSVNEMQRDLNRLRARQQNEMQYFANTLNSLKIQRDNVQSRIVELQESIREYALTEEMNLATVRPAGHPTTQRRRRIARALQEMEGSFVGEGVALKQELAELEVEENYLAGRIASVKTVQKSTEWSWRKSELWLLGKIRSAEFELKQFRRA